MDQLKELWAGVVKFHFWILTSLVLVSSIVAWYFSRNSLDQQIDSRISKLESDFTKVSQLKADSTKHPNAASEKEMDAMLNAVTMNVKEAWTKQYDRQKAILVWNRQVIKSDTVHAKLDSYRPIELFLDYPPPPADKDPITKNQREAFRDYIKIVFPDLAKIVGAKWTADLGTSSFASGDVVDDGTGGGAQSGTTGPSALVTWSQSSQATLQNSIVPWFNPTTSPTTLQICYTQEDIWILKGVLQVIRSTNENAKENFQAPIKEIEWIRIGKQASGGDLSMMPTIDPNQDPSAGGFSAGDVTGAPGMMSVPDPADGRYVDSNYKPVPSAKLRAAMKSAAPEDAFFAVAKRIPVRFKVKMDQAKIPKLLADCSNGDMMIEVKQTRINCGDGGIMIGGGMGFEPSMDPSMMPDDTMSGSTDDGTGDSGGGGGGFGGVDMSMLASVQPDPPVEVYGIVYLFNPVDLNKLGLDKVTENTTLVTTAEPVAEATPTLPPIAGTETAGAVNGSSTTNPTPTPPVPATPTPAAEPPAPSTPPPPT